MSLNFLLSVLAICCLKFVDEISAIRCYSCRALDADCWSNTCDAGADGFCYKIDKHFPASLLAGSPKTGGRENSILQSTTERGCSQIPGNFVSLDRCEDQLVPIQFGGGFARTCVCYTNHCNGSQPSRRNILSPLIASCIVCLVIMQIL